MRKVLVVMAGLVFAAVLLMGVKTADSPKLLGNCVISGTLTDGEVQMLVSILEEEKLAKDLYSRFYDIWKLPIFKNMADSESTHMEAIEYLLNSYNVPYSIPSDPGVFSNEELQSLYDQLLIYGSAEIEKAFEASAIVQDKILYDLENYILKVNNDCVKNLFNNLVKACEQHLKVLDSHILKYTGEHYKPRYISQERFESILNSQNNPGNGYGQGGTGSGHGSGAGMGTGAGSTGTGHGAGNQGGHGSNRGNAHRGGKR